MTALATRERFWGKVAKGDGCWVWEGKKFSNGYGEFLLNGKRHLAHRFAYETAKGEIPEGHQVHHVCGNGLCVNPDHLEAVTPKEHGEWHRKDRCSAGHLRTERNTYLYKGSRFCRVCRAARAAELRARRLGAP